MAVPPSTPIQPAPSIYPLAAGWNLIDLACAPDCAASAEGALQAMRGQGVDATQMARWHDGRWESHLPGFPANDFAIDPLAGYFVRTQAGGTWLVSVTAPPAAPAP